MKRLASFAAVLILSLPSRPSLAQEEASDDVWLLTDPSCDSESIVGCPGETVLVTANAVETTARSPAPRLRLKLSDASST